jgi:hypothetical protein
MLEILIGTLELPDLGAGQIGPLKRAKRLEKRLTFTVNKSNVSDAGQGVSTIGIRTIGVRLDNRCWLFSEIGGRKLKHPV